MAAESAAISGRIHSDVRTPDIEDPIAPQIAEEITRGGLARRFLSARTLLGFAVAAGILVAVWIVADLSLEDIVETLRRANPWLIAAAYGVFALAFPIRTWRWRILLDNAAHREDQYPVYRNWALFQILFISWFVNGLLPFKLGDVYRAYMARANFATSLTRTLGTIFTERVFDVGTLIGLVLISAAFVARSPRVSEEVGRIIAIAAIALGVLAVALALMLIFGRPIFRLFPPRAQGIYDRFHSGAFDSFTWGSGPVLLAMSVGIWSLELLRLALVTRGLGIDLGIAEIVFIGTAASLLLAVPTPGGLGAVEGGLLGLLRLVGIGSGSAGAAVIVDRVISYWSVMLFGAVVFVTTRLKRR